MKNHLPTLTLLSLLLLSLGSCDDDTPEVLPHTIIEGQVLEYGTNEPVENATVLLYKRISTGAFTGTDMRIDTAITNAAGEYSFQYEDSGKFGLFASADTYFSTNGIEYSNIRSKKMNTRNITLDPMALLELHVKNKNPFDANDYINVNGTLSGPWHGKDVDIKTTITVRGNKEEQVSWFITKNDSSYNQTELIYCKGHELTKYEILY